MDEQAWLAARFEETRPHLRTVAYRILGSREEAEDAVQEAWLRLSRSNAAEVENLGGWLTTVVSRVCLDALRSRKSRREAPLDDAKPPGREAARKSPEESALIADSLGLALLAVLDTLAPAERVAFVLHDLFDMPFDDIAPIVDRSPAAARQLASRARRRVRGGGARQPDRARQRAIVEAFLAASRDGNLSALLAVLDPGVELRVDRVAVEMSRERRGQGAPVLEETIRGADAVAGTFVGRAAAARVALIDGAPGAVWAPGGRPAVAFIFTVEDDRIVGIELVADRDHLGRLEVTFLDR